MNSNERDLLDDDELVAEMNKEAENLVREWYCNSQHRDELTEEVAVTLTAAYRRAEANAVTQTRALCAQAIRDMIPNYRSWNSYDCLLEIREVLETAAKTVEAVGLDQVE